MTYSWNILDAYFSFDIIPQQKFTFIFIFPFHSHFIFIFTFLSQLIFIFTFHSHFIFIFAFHSHFIFTFHSHFIFTFHFLFYISFFIFFSGLALQDLLLRPPLHAPCEAAQDEGAQVKTFSHFISFQTRLNKAKCNFFFPSLVHLFVYICMFF